jgi:hypothetical protein
MKTNSSFGWLVARFGLVGGLLLAAQTASAITVDEAVKTSKQTGKPILVIQGTET